MEKQLGQLYGGCRASCRGCFPEEAKPQWGTNFVHKLLHKGTMRRRFGNGAAELRCMMCLQELVPKLPCLTVEEHQSSLFGQH